MSAERWGRLVTTLADHGVEAKVIERKYQELRYGRPHSGTTRTIIIKHPKGGLVVVDDRWWSKNLDTWIGWEVTREDREGIILRSYPLTKKRGEVAAAVVEALR